jgi:predicted MFS family arabinose efflux permease
MPHPLTVPLGWAADRFDRRKVLGLGVILWSLATLGSAYALGFLSLVAMRGLVGVGEAAYGPISNAVLCESFGTRLKARVVAVFNGGMFAGAVAGMVIGSRFGFPGAFQLVAFPGLALGVAALYLRVPPRRADPTAERRGARLHDVFADAVRSLNVPTLRWMLVGGILISFSAGGYVSWLLDFLERWKGMTKSHASIVVGIITLTAGSTGVVVGGFVADRIQRRVPWGRAVTMGIGFLLAAPFGFASLYLPAGLGLYAVIWLVTFFIPWYNGPMAAVIDDVVDDRRASTAQASFSFVIHLLGTAPAAALVGYASSAWDLRTALLLPNITTVLAAPFCFMACRRVAADMAARTRRQIDAQRVS